MLLHSIHTLANLALKETAPPQSRTVTARHCKNYIFNVANSGRIQVVQKS